MDGFLSGGGGAGGPRAVRHAIEGSGGNRRRARQPAHRLRAGGGAGRKRGHAADLVLAAEPGNLDIEMFNVVGNPQGGNSFIGSDIEFEYGLKAWWTTEFYLDGQATQNDSTIFTGFRWENRVRLLPSEHWINPVFYAEFEDTSADKTIREVVGHDGLPDFLAPNWLARMHIEREIELKLILGSNTHGWNISENFIAEKNFAGEP